MAKLLDSIEYVFENEGGYSNDPEDSGGPTKWGLTKSDLSQFYRLPVGDDAIKNLSKLTATGIYAKLYWDPMRLDEVNDQKIATAVFDIGVNRGIHKGIEYAQEACGVCGMDLFVDGLIGKKTLAALNSVDRVKFISSFHDLVRGGYETIVAHNPRQNVFIRGWLRRADRLMTLA